MSIFSRIFGKGEGDAEASGDDGGAGTIKCPTCGTRSAADAAFCGECGATLKPDMSRAAQRKAATAQQAQQPANARPPLAPQTVNTLHAQAAHDPRGSSPVVTSRAQPQRK